MQCHPHPHQQKKETAFRISNKGLDHVDRYLTITNKLHSQEQKLLAESDYRRNDEDERNRQLWVIEQVEASKLYRVKHFQDNKYLTLIRSAKLNGYIAQFAPLDHQNQNQIWTFELAQNRRFFIGIPNPQNPADPKQKRLYLESTEVYSLERRYKTVLQCRFKIDIQQKRRYLQFWKISPLKQQVKLPFFDRQQALSILTEKQRQLLGKFQGAVYTRHTPGYQYQVYQYATSSFPLEQMSPYMLLEPINVQDIQIAICFAKLLGKHIVVRSGGHQYSGTSSGGDKTIVVSLNQFNDLKINNQGLLQVGPCNALRDVSKFLRDQGLSVPHGVCPLVNIGGHAQTGGYGNFTRSFGLLIDYVQAFDIVLASGEFKTVRRPVSANNKQQEDNLELFRGVMGGNAGSFGIVTRYYIKPIRDEDHPKSYTKTVVRVFSRQLFTLALKEFQKWTDAIAKDQDEEYRGLDLFFSLTQSAISLADPTIYTIMNLTGFYSDIDGGKPYNNQFEPLFAQYSKNMNLQEWKLNKFSIGERNGQRPLSFIAESYVVKYPHITEAGRQFDLPYQKRGNVTFAGLTDKFIQELTLQTQSIPKQPGFNLIVQMIAGGGQHRQKGNRKVNGITVTSIPLRRLTHTFSFDIFYDQKYQCAKERAKEGQKVMQQTVIKHYSAPVGEKLFFWTSYGDLDITKPEVVNRFYDNKEQYEDLQKLKRKVDPTNVFSSLMTVKP